MPSSKLGQASITLRCTAAEHKQIKAKVDAAGMTLSEYIRFVALNAEINVKVEGDKQNG